MKGGPQPLYLDTSCLLKLFFPEPESARVVELLAAEGRVIVSELARLEAETQLRTRRLAGSLTKTRHARLTAELDKMLGFEPFELVPFPQEALEGARQLAARSSVHSRTLDLLHVAVMDALGVSRILTNDSTQASLASDLGFEVVVP